MNEYLFVCGTLRKKFVTQLAPNLTTLMQALPFVGYGEIQGQLYDLGEFPGAILGENFSTKIVGEIYQLENSAQVFVVLDEYENFIEGELEASLFARVKAQIASTDGKEFLCWMYVYNDWVLNGTLIENGDYVNWESSR